MKHNPETNDPTSDSAASFDPPEIEFTPEQLAAAEAVVSESPPKKRHKSLEFIETIVVAVLMALVIRAVVAEARFIPSGSMLPTLQIGDRLIVEKVSYYFTDPDRGEIVVFYPPQPGQAELDTGQRFMRWLGFTTESAYIKRVVGLPGETVMISNGVVYINDQPLSESYIMAPPYSDMAPITVPTESYFMMGDNRNNSRDSRVWGTLPRKNVIGKTFLRFWPLTAIGAP